MADPGPAADKVTRDAAEPTPKRLRVLQIHAEEPEDQTIVEKRDQLSERKKEGIVR